MKPKKLVYILIILISLLVIIQVYRKYCFENKNKTIEICSEFNQIKYLCEKENYPVEYFLERIKVIGISSIVIDEETFNTLQSENKIIYFTANDISKLRVFELVSQYSIISPETVIIYDRKLAKYIIDTLNEKTNFGIKPNYIDNYVSINIKDKQYLKQIGWGYDKEKIALVSKYGLKPIIRYFKDNISWFPADLSDNISVLIYNKIPTEIVIDKIKLHNIKLPYFEFVQQDSTETNFLKKMSQSLIKTHRIDTKYLNKPIELLLNRWYRAVNERSCRLLYFDFNLDSSIEENLDYLRKLCNKLKSDGYKLDVVDLRIIPLNYLNEIPSGLLNIISLIISIIIPIFSIKLIFKTNEMKKEESVITILKKFFIIVSINLYGGLMLGAFLSNYKFIIGIEKLNVVKLSFLLPFVFIIPLLYSSQEIKEVLNKPVTLKKTFIFLFFVFIFLVVVLRSDYRTLQVSELELKLRALLESIFIYRPRFKEFLLGYPLLILGLYYRNRLLILLGLLGPVSIINTFVHVHTPIFVSILRTLYGILLGTIIGTVLIYISRRTIQLLLKIKKIPIFEC
jgi:hypothetical protein